MKKILNKKSFNRSIVAVARDLLGKFLVRKIGQREIASIIVEVEAYDGFKDSASHAYRGKTERNKIMFGEPGRWYVYFTYGKHWMLNIVTGPKGYPAAILIRSVENANGPGRLTKYFRIGENFNNKPASKKTGLWIEDKGIKIEPRNIKRAKRIGVDYAGKYWARRKLRFVLPKQN